MKRTRNIVNIKCMPVEKVIRLLENGVKLESCSKCTGGNAYNIEFIVSDTQWLELARDGVVYIKSDTGYATPAEIRLRNYEYLDITIL